MMVGLGSMSHLTSAERVRRIQSLIEGDPGKYPLTRILLAQYLYNLPYSSGVKKPYNSFQPFFFGINGVELYLCQTRRIQFAKILERDTSPRRREDYIIDSQTGSIKFTISNRFITVDCTALITVAKAEMNGNVPV